MKLNKEEIHSFIGLKMPNYEIKKMNEMSYTNPKWVHFGAGNIFRGYIARLQDDLLNEGLSNHGIIACESFDEEIIERIYKEHDNLIIVDSLDGSQKRVLASVSEALYVDLSNEKTFKRLQEIFINKELQMVSFTITEKGYALKNIADEYLQIVNDDFINGPSGARHIMSVICALLYQRYLHGKNPIALVSMDNCSHNGEKLKNAILEVANQWHNKRFVSQQFVDYLMDIAKVSYPLTMIDKITPRPSSLVASELEKMGFSDILPIMTKKNTYIAAYVNTEISEYLVIEDVFPNGRPPLEKVGVYFTNQQTVNLVEKMKVTTCLNPLHTALAIYGCILGYQTIHEEMENELLRNLVIKLGEEGMRVVTDPQIINPKEFINEVITIRLPNKAIPDSPQRIATDTSQKLAIRFGETIKSYLTRKDLNVGSLTYIPLVLAGWLRYLLKFDDQLNIINISSDPMMEILDNILLGIEGKSEEEIKQTIKKILTNETIFGVDLVKVGLSQKIEEMFLSMLQGVGAVNNTLRKYL